MNSFLLLGIYLNLYLGGIPTWTDIGTKDKNFFFPKDDFQCYSYIRRQTKRKPIWSSLYPKTVKGAIRWLRKAKREGRLIFGSVQIVAELQKHIDKISIGRLFIFIGHNHLKRAHYQFFNELISPGKDQIFLEGITHIALETFMTDSPQRKLTPRLEKMLYRLWKGRYNQKKRINIRKKLVSLIFFDQQPLIDLYLKRGKKWAYQLLEVIGSFFLYPTYSYEIIRAIHQTLTFARKYPKPIEVLATDMSVRLRSKYKTLTCWLYPLRELFALYIAKSRLKGPRNIFLFFWGANHIRRDNFPRFLSPQEKVLTILLNGGGEPDIWDFALQKIGIVPTSFAIYTPGAREADMMIHLPPEVTLSSKRDSEQSLSQMKRIPPNSPIDREKIDISKRFERRRLRALRALLSLCLKEKQRKKIYLKLQLNPNGQVIDVELYPPYKLSKLQRRCLNHTIKKIKFPPSDRFYTRTLWIK